MGFGGCVKFKSFKQVESVTLSSKTLTFLSGFQMVCDKMAPVCTDFKWFGFWFSGSIKYPDHLQPKLLLTIPNPD